MSEQDHEQFDAVDALLAQVREGDLPDRAERRRLREAAGLSHAEVGAACGVRRETAASWDTPKGTTEPRPPHRAAYARLLRGLASMFPPPAEQSVVPAWAAGQAAAARPEGPPSMPADRVAALSAAPAPAPERPARPARPLGKRAAGKTAPKRAAAAAAAEYANGPVAVLDIDDAGQVLAYCAGGVVLDVPATTLAALVEWTLTEAHLGAPRLHPWGRDADPLLVLTTAAAQYFGLPAELTEDERYAGRLDDAHPAVVELGRSPWKVTRRGVSSWTRIYRPVEAGQARQCVQVAHLGWDALDSRTWGQAAELHPAALAGLLAAYAQRVITPRGAAAVNGVELMTALRPGTRASRARDAEGRRRSECNPGSLGPDPVQCAPPEAPDGHPLLADLPRWHQRGPAERLFEEDFDWARLRTDEECAQRYVVGIDVNCAFAAAANGLVVGLSQAPQHVTNPVFDAKTPGAWLVDLSHVDLGRIKSGGKWHTLDASRLPSPFTPHGEPPEGPAWYATPTVAYAVELGYEVTPLEGWLRPEAGRYLDPWYERLRDAYLSVMAELGVVPDMGPQPFLDAMAQAKTDATEEQSILLTAIKGTIKGGIGKLQQRPRGGGWRPGQPWPALARPTWRPDIRAAVIAQSRTNMHRKMIKHALATGQYPVAVRADCVVYASNGPSPLDFLPYPDGRPVPGGWRLGVSPGMVKWEGTQGSLWAEEAAEKYGAVNLARYVKNGFAAAGDDAEEGE
ncbi:telomere-associated protein Tap [Streptomyces sp. VTCC 41912]|uniref:telomere-associated protein Tap n=1 Tax=Streptomyces sp. VTCC 41912 TaxID=3383243 RepID=UPI003896B748